MFIVINIDMARKKRLGVRDGILVFNDRAIEILSHVIRQKDLDVKAVSKATKVPRSTVYLYVKRYITGKGATLSFKAAPNPLKISLRPAYVILDGAKKEFKEALLDRRLIDYWTGYVRAYDSGAKDIFEYAVPAGREASFMDLFNEAYKAGLFEDYEIYWTTATYGVNWGFKWYSTKEKRWKFDWDSWVKEMLELKVKLPETLTEVWASPINLDEIDTKILKVWEKRVPLNAFIVVAREEKLSIQTVKYHYIKHLAGREIFEFRLTGQPFGIADTYLFVFEFTTEENMASFVKSLNDKPFTNEVARITDARTGRLENSIILKISLPPNTLVEFLRVLDKLIEENFLKKFEYNLLDLTTEKRRTLPYHNLNVKKGVFVWKYDEWLSEIKKLAK